MNIDKTIENGIMKLLNNIKATSKFSKEKKNKMINTLHPLRVDIVSVIIYTLGALLFIFIWYFIKADSYLTPKTVWVKYFIFILAIIVLLLNIWLSSEKPSNYETEIEIQRSIEKNAFYITAGILGLSIFTYKLKHIFKSGSVVIKLPFLFLCTAFILTYFIFVFINLPKIGIIIHYYRNIISKFLNLAVIYVISAIIYIIAVIIK